MSKETFNSPSPQRLAEAARTARGKGLPPVHLWNPAFSGDIDMHIARDGTWLYQGSRIDRPALVALFASILRREGEKYFLVTPVEKVGITVDDVPFIAVDVTAEGTGAGQTLIFDTNIGDRAVAGPEHPIRVEIDPASGEPAPYVTVRDRLEARIDRKSFYRLAEHGCHEDGWFGLWSDGVFFRVLPSIAMAGEGAQ